MSLKTELTGNSIAVMCSVQLFVQYPEILKGLAQANIIKKISDFIFAY